MDNSNNMRLLTNDYDENPCSEALDEYGVLYSKDGKFILECKDKNLTEYTIKYGTEKICCRAFSECHSLIRVFLPDSIRHIDDSAFNECTSLSFIRLPYSLETIGIRVFRKCLSLSSIHIPKLIKSIPDDAFSDCENLTMVELEEGILSIDRCAFSGCTRLMDINIPQSINKIDRSALYECKNLKITVNGANIDIRKTIFSEYTENQDNEIIYDWEVPNVGSIFTTFVAYKKLRYVECLKMPSVEIDVQKEREGHSHQLKLHSSYYHNFGMNLTRMSWNIKKGEKSYKDPVDENWRKWISNVQEQNYVLSQNWDDALGCGMVLGYNNYRAIDVDGICGNIKNAVSDFLVLLGLPFDYPWVVMSGSGEGFHIIFIADDCGDEMESVSFAPNDEYLLDDYGIFRREHSDDEYAFARIELRWTDHLVLPPSYHSSGNKYEFLNGGLPSAPPQKVTINDIDNLLVTMTCKSVLRKYKYNDKNLILIKDEKKFVKEDSWNYITEIKANDSINWMRLCTSSSAYNSLAIEYFIGKRVEKDPNKAYQLLMKSKSQDSYFNIASLVNCGFLRGGFKDVQYCLSKVKDAKYKKYVKQVASAAQAQLRTGKLYLFLDTETTGLDYDSSHYKRPRLVQISWIVSNSYGDILSKESHIIKPNGFTIPKNASDIHNITTEFANKEGENLSKVLKLFMDDFNKCDCVVGHNLNFDKRVVEAELRCMGEVGTLEDKKSICTMEETTDFCKIGGRYRYKFPKLQELYYKLFGQHYSGVHDSMSDVDATLKCFWELRRRGLI